MPIYRKDNQKPRKTSTNDDNETRYAMLRLQNKYVCPYCTAADNGKEHIHRIGGSGSERCIEKNVLAPIARYNRSSYKLRFETNYYEFTKQKYFHPECENWDYFKGKIRTELPHLHEKLMNIENRFERGTEITASIRTDYWKMPEIELHTQVKNLYEELSHKYQKDFSELDAEIMEHRALGKCLWKGPGDLVLYDDPECELLAEYRDDFDEYPTRNAMWSKGMVIGVLTERRHHRYAGVYITEKGSHNVLSSDMPDILKHIWTANIEEIRFNG